MSLVSRRAFLHKGSLTMVVAGVATAVPGLSTILAGSAAEAPAVDSASVDLVENLSLDSEVIAHVRDLETGEIAVEPQAVLLRYRGHQFRLDLPGHGTGLPPCNIGPLSTPNYTSLSQAAVHSLSNGVKVFAGQRAEGFFVDLGSVFDLADLRPFVPPCSTSTFPGMARSGRISSLAAFVTPGSTRSECSPSIWTTCERSAVTAGERP